MQGYFGSFFQSILRLCTQQRSRFLIFQRYQVVFCEVDISPAEIGNSPIALRFITGRFICVCWLLAAGLTLPLHCGAQAYNTAIKTTRVHPKFLYTVEHTFRIGGHQEGEFDSPEIAFEAVKKRIIQDYADSTSYLNAHGENLRPEETQVYLNGAPTRYVWDIGYTDVNGDKGTFTQVAITLNPHCEPGWTYVSTQLSARERVMYCEKNVSERDPAANTCPIVPNPVFAETGLKHQVEIDYADPKGLLGFQRTWRSDQGNFIYVGQSGLIDYSSQLEPSDKCHEGFYASYEPDGSYTNKAYCFPYLGTGSNEYHVYKANGDQIVYVEENGLFVSRADHTDVLTRSGTNDGSAWQLRTQDNVVESYDAKGKLQKRHHADGRFVLFSYSDATTPFSIAPREGLLLLMMDSDGRKLQLSYNASGELNTLVDPDGGVIAYTYGEVSGNCGTAYTTDQCQRLTSVTYQDGGVRRYHYNESDHLADNLDPTALGIPAFLTGITDENGVRLSHYRYDSNGRVTTSGWGGFDYALTYPSSTQTTITDPSGTMRSYSLATILNVKRLVGQSQPAGAGCGPSSVATTYDVNGNIVSKKDFNGYQSFYGYDTSRNLETSRVEGAPASASTALLVTGSELPAGAGKVTTQWHDVWRLPIKISEPLKLTTYVYNGDIYNGSAASCTPSDARVGGSPIAVLCKKIEQVTNDTNGEDGFSVVFVGTPRAWTYTYTSLGKILTETDPRGNVTSYTYDALGNLATHADTFGHTTAFTGYDANGRAGKLVDANGLVTSLTYTARGWLASHTIDGDTTRYDYDGVGQLTGVTLPDGSSLTYTYDDAHRLTAIADSLGNRIAYTLDLVGNRIGQQTSDPNATLARQTSRVYDSLNRLQQRTGGGQ